MHIAQLAAEKIAWNDGEMWLGIGCVGLVVAVVVVALNWRR